eukprot:2785742-Pyramimonas_sp.AAC.1
MLDCLSKRYSSWAGWESRRGSLPSTTKGTSPTHRPPGPSSSKSASESKRGASSPLWGGDGTIMAGSLALNVLSGLIPVAGC